MGRFKLVSHHLYPYVQRVAIALAERAVPFVRITIDLADKPAWFVQLSPLGKVPLLDAGGTVIFESAAILEYLEDVLPQKLHPANPLRRAEHRAWMEFGSAVLNSIAAFYNAPDAEAFEARLMDLRSKFQRVEEALGDVPWFAGASFSLVDTVFAPVFRYFEVFDALGLPSPLAGLPRLARWRQHLMARKTVIGAVSSDYPERLTRFLEARRSHVSRLIAEPAYA